MSDSHAIRTRRWYVAVGATLLVAATVSWLGPSTAEAVPRRAAAPTAVAGNHLARVTWTAPAVPEQLYVVSIFEAGSEIDSLVVPATDTSMTVAPLLNGHTYRFRVGGSANGSTLSNAVTPTNVCTVTGTRFDDVLVGTPGDDAICGRGGADRMLGLGGGDSYVGGTGIDTVDYSREAEAVRALLDFGSSLYPGLGYADFASSIDTEAIVAESVTGSRFDDELRGTPRFNVVDGGPGDDIVGNPFGDFMAGGPDRLRGGGGDDRLLGVVKANESYDGGPGMDLADFGFAPNAVRVDLAAGTVESTGQGTVGRVEVVRGSAFADTILGDGLANLLRGFNGNDVLRGRLGDDRLHGDSGNDALHGDGGTDSCFGGSGTDTADGCESVTDVP